MESLNCSAIIFVLILEIMEYNKVLIADDEPDILDIISFNLKKEGYEVVTAVDGDDALQKAKETLPDLIVLDIMMPNKSGIEVCEILRTQPEFQETMIIFLTALNDENTHIKGLDTGADDYISKPISTKLLTSRVNALFRRKNKESEKTIQVGNILIDPVRFVVSIDNEQIILAKKEFELLYLLASKPGRVFLRNEILQQIWGADVHRGRSYHRCAYPKNPSETGY